MYSSVPSPPWNASPQPILERARTATSPVPSSPTSPTRMGRLRGLSYLRSYTQNHILSRESHGSSSSQRQSTLTRSTSSPPRTTAGTSTRESAAASPALDYIIRQASPPAAPRSTTDLTPTRTNNSDTVGSTSGWLPTVGGQSGVSRIVSEAQSIPTAASSAVLATSTPSAITSDLTASMGRTRSATGGGATEMPQVNGGEPSPHDMTGEHAGGTANGTNGTAHQLPSIRFCAHQDPRAQRPSLVFSPTARILPTGKEVIKVGRYSERDNQPVQAVNVPSAAPVGFKSKVVSRRHCEFWSSGGRWYIKDVKSSSGTFLNHIRLSSPGTESRPYPINDGDIVQLGIDFKGGEEMIFRCVKIRVELNKGWQNGPSSFNVQSHKRLRELNAQGKPSTSGSSQDCSICLGPIAPCQSLFVAPCSHTWHYKCIRVIINGPHWPHFICPNCRTVADLEAELDPYPEGEWEEIDDAEADADADATTRPIETDEGVATAAESHQQANGIENAESTQQVETEESEQEHSVPDDDNGAETSNDSVTDQRVQQAADELGYLDLDGLSSPAETVTSPGEQANNSTVAPVDIINRKIAPHLSAGISSGRVQPNSRPNRDGNRTPSPNSFSASVLDANPGPDGPMTPRNDAGPFVFDGSAGEVSGIRPPTMGTLNLNAAAEGSAPIQPQPQPQPQPQTT